MVFITVELLRKRAEHNEGCLSTLKEITLHQQDLERITLIGDLCRELEIIYLCNNYIPRIEGLKHLKNLTYLNLAINNIKKIEGLDGCESLQKLDLTLNFISDLTSIVELRKNTFLTVLYLTGNPCTKISGYRSYVVHLLPQLETLDSEEITKTETIVARQDEPEVQTEVELEKMKVEEEERVRREMVERGLDPFPAKFNAEGERVYGHSAEERMQMLREQEEKDRERKRKEQEELEKNPNSITAIHRELQQLGKRPVLSPEEELEKYGHILHRNEAKIAFTLVEDDDCEIASCYCEPGHRPHPPSELASKPKGSTLLLVEPGKYISTTLIDIKLEPMYIRVTVKGKVLQLGFNKEVSPTQATVQRSATTGQLKICVKQAAVIGVKKSAEPQPTKTEDID